jgi:tartrate-resistant acid phosphatase type 5
MKDGGPNCSPTVVAHKARCTTVAVWLALLPGVYAQKFHTYVGDVAPTEVLIAWGTTAGANTIGRSSPSHGPAVVRIDGKEIRVADKNWAVISGLKPDTDYPYEVLVRGRSIGKSQVRTWPEKSEKLRFFVIGDWGSGDSAQRGIATAMVKEFQRYSGDNPVRFVITTGDNVYGQIGLMLRFSKTGNSDTHWESKFFAPYEPLIRRIPFYPTLGNHDGNETESRDDLATYLDNFFFPGHTASRYYRFSFGGLVDFFALDSTTNSEDGPPRPAYRKDSDQHKWLQSNLADSRVPWKIPFFHHPPFNAGPRHPAAADDLAHFLELFKDEGVKVVFSGHEHNFQFSKKNKETGGIRYIVSGAGGELRTGDVRDSMDRAQIEGWAPVLHFLSIEIEGKEMRITPISTTSIDVVNRDGGKINMPLRVTLD